jgi:uncharacterized repeat protein (TIGR03806 family)
MKNIFLVLLITVFILSCKSDDTPEQVVYPKPELLENLSELNLFKGNLSDLTPTDVVAVYDLQTPLFTDFALKKRFISIPKGETMIYNDEGFPEFPNNTILAKTFYYYIDERNPSLGKKIIETRVLIKKAGIWEIGNYVWNEDQTDAIRDEAEHTILISWINNNGDSNTFNYVIPDYQSCVMCHNISGVRVPIGPKIRNMNVGNKLQEFIDMGILSGISDVSTIEKLPNWKDVTYSQEERSRAYLDVNCAHCHQPNGYYSQNFNNDFEFRYETRFSDTHILEKRDAIITRMHSNIQGYKMPYIGTTLTNIEAVNLIEDYLNSL